MKADGAEAYTIITGVQVPDDVIALLREQMAKGGFETVGQYLADAVRKAHERDRRGRLGAGQTESEPRR